MGGGKMRVILGYVDNAVGMCRMPSTLSTKPWMTRVLPSTILSWAMAPSQDPQLGPHYRRGRMVSCKREERKVMLRRTWRHRRMDEEEVKVLKER